MGAIARRHFDMGFTARERRHRTTAAAGAQREDLAQLLRNFVDELTIRIQSGTATMAAGVDAAVTIAFAVAMPTAAYRVALATASVSLVAANGGMPLTATDVSAKTVAGFTVTAGPAGAVAVDVVVDYIARHDTRINTNA